jgi:protoporphyrinogen oxidase
MRYTKYLILGAGITGLSCATKLSGKDYLILEKNKGIGGYCSTFYKGEYVWDYAGHFFHFNNKEIKEEFSDLLNGEDTVHNVKNTKIYYKGTYIDYPFQYNIHQLEKSEMIDCLVGLYDRPDGQINTFKEMLFSKFGDGISNKFLIPYNTKLYACDLDNLDKGAMGRFFPYAEPEEIILGFKKEQKKTYNDNFFYSSKGAVAFVDRIAQNVDADKILTNTTVKRIDLENKTVFTDKEAIKYEYLINTVPFSQFVEISNMHLNVQLSANQVLVFNMGFDKPSIDPSLHWIYYPGDECFYRVGFYNNILHRDKLSIYVEIGFNENEIIDVEKYMKQTLEDLKRVGIITDHNLVESNHIIMNPAYVHICDEIEKVLNSVREELNSKNVFCAGRYGNWTYCSIEDCILQAYSIAEKILGDSFDWKNTK